MRKVNAISSHPQCSHRLTFRTRTSPIGLHYKRTLKAAYGGPQHPNSPQKRQFRFALDLPARAFIPQSMTTAPVLIPNNPWSDIWQSSTPTLPHMYLPDYIQVIQVCILFTCQLDCTLPGRAFIPQSMTTAPGLIQSTLTKRSTHPHTHTPTFIPHTFLYWPGRAFIPQSMTTAPGLIQSPLTKRSCPTATTKMSAPRHWN